MPGENIGVLEIEIRDNASEAGEGLSSLATALGSVSTNASKFDLTGVSTKLNKFTGAIARAQSSSTVYKNIASFGDGLKNIVNAANSASKGINTEPIVSAISEIKAAVSEGMHLGTAGTQIKNIREALMSEWKTDSAYQAGMALSAIGEGAKSLVGTSLGTKAKDISALAKALSEYADASAKVKDVLGSSSSIPKGTGKGMRIRGVDDEGNPIERYMGLQFFGGRKSKTDLDEVSSRQISRQYELLEEHQRALDAFFSRGKENISETAKSPVDSMLEKTSENIQNVSDEYKNMISGMGDTAVNMSAFDPSKLPLGMLGMTLRDLSQGAAQFTGNLNESFGLITTGANETADQMQEKFQDSFGMIVRDAKENASETNESLSSMIVPQREMFDNTQIEDGRISYDSLREGAIEVEGTVGDVASSVHGYLTGIVEDIKKVEEEANNAKMSFGQSLEEMLRNMYAATTGVGPALRGEKGDSAYFGTIKQIADMRGVDEAEVIHKLMDIRDDAREAKKEIDGLMESLNQPIQSNMNWSQGIDRMLGIGSEVKSAKDSMSAFLQGMQGSEEISQTIRDMNPELAEVSEKFQDAAEAAKEYAKSAKDAESSSFGFKETFKGMLNIFKTSAIGRLAKQFLNLAKRMAIRAIIRQVTSAFKEGVENVYRYSDAIGGSFAANMDSAATALFQMKNSIGAAIAPAIQAVLPFVNQLVNGFIEVVNKINQVFALLNGQSTWTRALPYAKKAFDDQKKSAKGAHDAMKDLLADWDELNIIQSQSGGNGGGSSGKEQEDYTAMFEEVASFDSNMQDIANFIKDLIGFVKDNLVEIVGLVTAIKWGAKLAKFSNAFAGILGDILGLASAGFIINLTIDAVSKLDKKYLETGNPGYLVADTLATLIGGFFAKKVLSKVLGGSFAKIAIPLTFAISAGTTINALVQDTDVSALSEEGILASLNAALKDGIAAGSAAFSLAEWSAAKSLGMGVAGAAFTFGLSIGIKAISETVNMGEITSSVIESDLIAAASIGAGLAIGAAVLGGTIGTIVAAGVGGAAFAFALLVGIEALVAKDAPKKVMYGDVELTDEEVQKFVEAKMFSININATIDNINATVASKKKLETQVQTALTNSGADFNLIKLGIAKDDDYAQLKNDILGEDGNGGLVGEVSKYIDEAKSMGKLTLSLTPELVGSTTQDASEWFTTYTTGWDLVDQFVKEKGADIGKLLTTEEGKKIIESTPEVLAALMQQVSDVTNAITGAQISSEAFANLNLNIGDLSETSLDKVMTAYESYIDQLTAKERELAIQQYTSQGELVAGLIAMGADPNKDPLKSALEEYEYMGEHINDAVEKSVNRASKPGREMIKKHFAELFNVEAPDIKTNAPMVMQMVNSLGISLREGLDKSTIENDINNLLENILSTTFSAEDFKFIKQAVNLGAMNYIDFFDNSTLEYILSQFNNEEYKKKIRSAWEKMVQESVEEAEPVTIETKTEVENTVEEVTKHETTTAGIEESPVVKEAKEAVEKVNEISQEAQEAKKGILTLDDMKFDTSGVTSSANAAASSIEEMARRIREAFATLDGLSYEMDISGTKYSGAMSVLIPKIEQRASGGFVRSGDLVMANENGNFEMMGRMGNQPVVANNQQIVNGISSGVAQANGDVVSELRTLTTLMQRMLNKEFVARAVPSSAWGGHNARSQDAYDKVNG